MNEILKLQTLPRQSANTTLLSIQNVTRTYNTGKESETRALTNVSFDIFAGEFLAITGHSGSGKSTLLNIMGLVDDPTSGTVFADGSDLVQMNVREKQQFQLHFVSFIFQFFNLIDNYTAIENIMFPLRLQGQSVHNARTKAKEVLSFLNLSHRADHFPSDLSGGEQQRVAIGRAIAKESAIILADEPTAHLDTKNSKEVIDLLRSVTRTYGRTVVLVTHDPAQAEEADRNVVLKDGAIIKITQSHANM